MPIRLAIIDEHTLIRYGLSELAAQHSDIEIVAECQSAADARRVIVAVQPDVVTVEVGLPDGDGLRLAREFRNRYAGLGIVVLTSQHEDDVLFQALEIGVSAFVAKTAPLEEMLAAIRHAAVAASSFTASGLAVALARRRTVQDRLVLSRREREVLRLLHDGLSIPAIAMALFISHSTAKTYVARLYEKLGAANRAQALMTAMHYGLIHYAQEEPPSVPGLLNSPARAFAQRTRLGPSLCLPACCGALRILGQARIATMPGTGPAVGIAYAPGHIMVSVLDATAAPARRDVSMISVPAGRTAVGACQWQLRRLTATPGGYACRTAKPVGGPGSQVTGGLAAAAG